MALRDENADASTTGPTPSRESKMRDIPAWARAPQDIPNGSRKTLNKDKPAG